MDTDPKEDPSSEETAEPVQTAEIDILPPLARRKSGTRFSVVLILAILAAGIGAAGGAGISYVLIQKAGQSNGQDLVAQIQSAQQNQASLNAALDNLKERLARAETPVDLSLVEARLAALEARPIVTEAGTVIDPALVARVAALEKAPKPEPTPMFDASALEARVGALEAQNETDAEALNAADMGAAVAEIEKRLSTLEAQDMPLIPEPVDLGPLTSRLEALESQSAQTDVKVTNLLRASMPLPPFPKAEVTAALSKAGTSKKSWLGRTLDKHVRVGDEAALDIVADIERLLDENKVDAALGRIQDLPAAGQKAARDWVNQVKTQRTSL